MARKQKEKLKGDKMNTLTLEKALSVGGKVWEKEELKRVYLSASAVNALVESEGYASLKVTEKMKSAKTFLDLRTGDLKSDVGMIRSALNSIGYACK